MSLYRLDANPLRGNLLCHGSECVHCLQIDARYGRKIEHHQFDRRGFGADAIQNGVANVLHIEINQAGFGPKDQNSWNELVRGMPFTVGKAIRPCNPSKERHMRT